MALSPIYPTSTFPPIPLPSTVPEPFAELNRICFKRRQRLLWNKFINICSYCSDISGSICKYPYVWADPTTSPPKTRRIWHSENLIKKAVRNCQLLFSSSCLIFLETTTIFGLSLHVEGHAQLLAGQKGHVTQPSPHTGEGRNRQMCSPPNKWVASSVNFPHRMSGFEFSVCVVHFREYVRFKFLNITT